MRNGRLFITGFYLYYKEEEKVEIREEEGEKKEEGKGLVGCSPAACFPVLLAGHTIREPPIF